MKVTLHSLTGGTLFTVPLTPLITDRAALARLVAKGTTMRPTIEQLDRLADIAGQQLDEQFEFITTCAGDDRDAESNEHDFEILAAFNAWISDLKSAAAKELPRCAECGSDDIAFDALADSNGDLITTFDAWQCRSCESTNPNLIDPSEPEYAALQKLSSR